MRRMLPALLALLLGGCSAPPAGVPAPAPTPAPRTVVTLGDSVPAGTACGCDPFPALYARAQHATDINLAEPGATAADLRAGLPAERDVLSSATEVVIMTGANDIADSFDDASTYAAVAAGVERDVAASIAAIEQLRAVPVIVLGYWNVVRDGQAGADAYGPDGVRQSAEATTAVNNALRTAAAQPGASFIATYPVFHGADGTADPTSLLAADGDHPDAAGHAAIAALLPVLP